MFAKSPLARVKEEFGSKDKLVERIVSLVEAGDEPKEDLRKRLLGAANSKLLRLHNVASSVKTQFGSKDKLLDAAAVAIGRAKDKDYVGAMAAFSPARLLDILTVARRKGGPVPTATPGTGASAATPSAPATGSAPSPSVKKTTPAKAAARTAASTKSAAPKAKPVAKAKAAAKGSAAAKAKASTKSKRK